MWAFAIMLLTIFASLQIVLTAGFYAAQ